MDYPRGIGFFGDIISSPQDSQIKEFKTPFIGKYSGFFVIPFLCSSVESE